MEESEFEKLLAEAIDKIPDMYQSKIKNLTFRVEPEPTFQQRSELGLRSCDALYGLYSGVPLTRRGGAVNSIVPDVITIFMHPMIELHPKIDDLKNQIFKTLWHEVAHYFGLDHDRIHAIETKKT